MKRLLALVLLLAIAPVFAAGPNVATCATAADGATFGAAWLPCVSPATYVGPIVPSTTIVAAQRLLPTGVYANLWVAASHLQPADRVWGNASATATGASWYPPGGVLMISGGPVLSVGLGTISWVAPTTNTDGTPITPLDAFYIYQSATCAALAKVASVAATQLTYKTTGLPAGSYCFAVTAHAVNGKESVKSNTALLTITATQGAATPGQPRSMSIAVTVTATAP